MIISVLKSFVAITALALVSACVATSPPDHAGHSGHGTYAGQQSRDIKALSEDEVKGYLSGAGMGFAKPAELNRYPGPMHALEHADKLLLTTEQRAALDALLKAHKAQARALGAEVVRIERELDRLFAERRVENASLEAKLAEAGAAQARLRASHLKAHLATTRLLTAAQVDRYVQLRGYGNP